MPPHYFFCNLGHRLNFHFFCRQAKDRYFYDGAESLKGYPTSEFDMEMKQTDDRQSDIMGPTSLIGIQQPGQTGTLRSNVTQFTSLGSTMAGQQPQQQQQQQLSVMNGSVISAPVFMSQQQQRPMFMGPTPAQSLVQLGQPSIAASTVSMVSQPYLPPTTPNPPQSMGYPSGPLPQTPKAMHLPPFPPASPGYKLPHDPSSDSLMSANRMTAPQLGYSTGKQITDSPQLSSSGRGSGRTDDSTDSGMSIPRAPTPPSQPLVMPKAHKLVPGRMTTQKERKREIPSTAV